MFPSIAAIALFRVAIEASKALLNPASVSYDGDVAVTVGIAMVIASLLLSSWKSIQTK